MSMQMALEPPLAAHRRPAPLELLAAGLLVVTVVLHVVAMVPAYFVASGGNSSLVSQPDQAALYAVLAASWALALAIGFTGPHRTPVAAALAAGVAATELGFRVADLGDALRYGTSLVGAGLWLMEAAWVVGAAGAVIAVVAVRHRHGAAGRLAAPHETARSAAFPAGTAEWQTDGTAPTAFAPGRESGGEAHGEMPVNPYADPTSAGMAEPLQASAPLQGGRSDQSSPVGEAPTASDSSAAMSVSGNSLSGTQPAHQPGTGEDSHERAAWTMLVVVLALLVAGAFLPAWDHAVAYSPVTGQGINRSLGNAFSGPWQQVIGTVLAAVAMAAVPAVAVRLRNRVAGAAAVCGSLLVLGSQLTAAVVQVDQPVSPAQVGLSGGEAARLGLQLALKLTGWFTVDALAAYALFAAVLVWATLRAPHENSPGSRPSAPDFRNDAIPWAS